MDRRLKVAAGVAGVAISVYIAVGLYGHYTVFSGTVVDKGFDAAHTTLTTNYHYNAATKTSMPYTTTIYHPDRWSIDIEGTNAAGNLTTSNWAVPEHAYKLIEIGDYWSSK